MGVLRFGGAARHPIMSTLALHGGPRRRAAAAPIESTHHIETGGRGPSAFPIGPGSHLLVPKRVARKASHETRRTCDSLVLASESSDHTIPN